jgi:hypothetical protein
MVVEFEVELVLVLARPAQPVQAQRRLVQGRLVQGRLVLPQLAQLAQLELALRPAQLN